jgi:Icc-related predicted phosphoesterase
VILLLSLKGAKEGKLPIFVILSDTHNRRVPIPKGDVLIHCGDLTSVGLVDQLYESLDWLAEQPHPIKIAIAGNHDFCLQTSTRDFKELVFGKQRNIIYLQDDPYSTHGYQVWGSPWTNRYGSWAFMQDEPGMEEVANKIPSNTEILITHGPPFGILDQTYDGRHAGSSALRRKVQQLPKLKIHCFGHIHERGGRSHVDGGVIFVNAAVLDLRYKSQAPPVVVDLPRKNALGED